MFVSSLLPYIRECCFVGHLKSIIYYTDQHDVDEDLTAIAEQSGQWSDITQTGIALRNISSRPTAAGGSVASKK